MIEPELAPLAGSEIEATIDLTSMGLDGRPRPFLIHQEDNEDVLALTYEDARRLLEFLTGAVVFVREYQERITQ